MSISCDPIQPQSVSALRISMIYRFNSEVLVPMTYKLHRNPNRDQTSNLSHQKTSKNTSIKWAQWLNDCSQQGCGAPIFARCPWNHQWDWRHFSASQLQHPQTTLHYEQTHPKATLESARRNAEVQNPIEWIVDSTTFINIQRAHRCTSCTCSVIYCAFIGTSCY